MDESVFLICAVVAVCSLTAAIAARKGRSPLNWVGIAFLISVVAPIILIFLKRGPNSVTTYSGVPQAVVAVIAGVLAYLSAQRIQPRAEDFTCAAMTADVVRISDENTKASPGLKVLTISNPVEKSRGPETIECSGSALIATSATVPISFKAQKTNGQWFVFYNIYP